jgi:GT2 family glycosyltransferase
MGKGIMKKVRIITATAKNQIEFPNLTLLGQSLGLFPKQSGLEITVFPNNSGNRRKGLGSIYNTFFDAGHGDEILLFVHDDVYIHDWHLVNRLNDAIEHYDVIGLAGNTNPDFAEPSWMLAWNREKYPSGRQPKEHYSGVVGHMVKGRTHISEYGKTPVACQLLDGLFLAVNARKVLDAGVRFDEHFSYHFYDLDFCRQCRAKGLKMGTWPIAVTHASGGAYNSQEWTSARDRYLSKWR